MRTVFTWGLIAFFFFGGLAFTLWDETSWIGIGQIWMAVSILLAVIFVLASGKLKGRLSGKFSSGGSSGGDAGISAAKPIQRKPGGLASRVIGKLVDAANSGDTIKVAQTPGTADPTPAVAAGDTVEQLERLERLKQSGDLTDAEYQTQRNRILSQD